MFFSFVCLFVYFQAMLQKPQAVFCQRIIYSSLLRQHSSRYSNSPLISTLFTWILGKNYSCSNVNAWDRSFSSFCLILSWPLLPPWWGLEQNSLWVIQVLPVQLFRLHSQSCLQKSNSFPSDQWESALCWNFSSQFVDQKFSPGIKIVQSYGPPYLLPFPQQSLIIFLCCSIYKLFKTYVSYIFLSFLVISGRTVKWVLVTTYLL